jgi:hypothetical protein
VTLSFSLIGGDPDAEPIIYNTLGALPAGTFFDDKSGTFEWTPTFDQAGAYPITFGVTDSSGATDCGAQKSRTLLGSGSTRCRIIRSGLAG